MAIADDRITSGTWNTMHGREYSSCREWHLLFPKCMMSRESKVRGAMCHCGIGESLMGAACGHGSDEKSHHKRDEGAVLPALPHHYRRVEIRQISRTES